MIIEQDKKKLIVFENRELMMVVPSWSIVLILGGTNKNEKWAR